jgi:hypothetical protein
VYAALHNVTATVIVGIVGDVIRIIVVIVIVTRPIEPAEPAYEKSPSMVETVAETAVVKSIACKAATLNSDNSRRTDRG